MRFDGEWLLCDDGISRPIMRCEVLAENSRWRAAELLIDTGADRTVFSANLLAALGAIVFKPGETVRGVGGLVPTIAVATQIRLIRDGDRPVVFRGEFLGCADQELLDMSVLGRDIMRQFAVIVDRPADRVCLLGGAHHYVIEMQ